MSTLEDLWRRASTPTPPPDASTIVVIMLVALACVLFAWPAVRMAVTVCHEAGHAVAAALGGRSLDAIRLHSDTSGVTVTRGKAGGIGLIFTLLAGYPAASLVGVALAAVTGAGRAAAVLGLLVALLVLMLVKVRNLHGAVVVVGLAGALALAVLYAPDRTLGWLTVWLAWLLLLAGPRPVLELALGPGRAAAVSDAAQLARLTHLPRMVWIGLWLVGSLAALAAGVVLLLPELTHGRLT